MRTDSGAEYVVQLLWGSYLKKFQLIQLDMMLVLCNVAKEYTLMCVKNCCMNRGLVGYVIM